MVVTYKISFQTFGCTKIPNDDCIVVELASPHAWSVWGSKGEMVRAAKLVAYCNYFSKKKKKSQWWLQFREEIQDDVVVVTVDHRNKDNE